MLKLSSSKQIAAGVLALAMLPGVRAQVPPEVDAPVQTVQITGTRDPALLTYRDVAMLRSVFSHADASAVRVGLQVTARRDGKPVPNLRVQFVADGQKTDIPLKAGFILLNDLPATDDPDAEFLSNQRKGSLKMEVLLLAGVQDPEHFFAHEINQAIGQANKIRSTVLPWYLRIMTPKYESAAACFADPAGTLTVAQGAERRVLAASPSDDCVAFKPLRDGSATEYELNRAPLYVRLL